MPALLIDDPVCFARDSDGRLEIPLRLARGLEGVLVRVGVALRLYRGEFFANLDAGMPWLPSANGLVSERDAILGARYDAAKTAAAVRREILGIPGVSGIPELRVSFDGPSRTLSISFRVRTRFGDSEPTTIALT